MPFDRPIRILIVEDQDVVRIGLNLSLETCQDIEVISEVCDGVSAVEEAVALKPDVILMDIGLPKLDGIAAATLIKQELATRIIMFTDHDDDQSVYAALSAGADGYCLKDVTAEQLVKAIKTVADGALWLDERVADRVLRSCSIATLTSGLPELANQPEYEQSNQPEQQEAATATAQQMDVLSLMVEGLDADVIGKRLGISTEAVNSCLVEVMDKLSKSERAQAALSDLRREMFKDVPGLSKWCPKCQRDLDPSFEVCPFDAAPLDLPATDHLVGKTFAERYEILDLLGQGAMGIVYKARHKFMNRLVAIKILHPFLLMDVNNLKRFRQEAEAAAALQHPNVIHIVDFGLTSSGEAFLIMELLEGTSLDTILRKEGKLSVDRSVDLFLQCCDALEHAHSHGIIHRDLKPSNVVLHGSNDSVKIVDFGIAKIMSRDKASAPSLTQEGVIHGSPAYMSPEQVQGTTIDARTDIYSFACLMYETLSGRPPFVVDSAIDAMYMQVRGTPEKLNDVDKTLRVPEGLDKVIMKALAKEPSSRQQSVAELKQELLPFRSSQHAIN